MKFLEFVLDKLYLLFLLGGPDGAPYVGARPVSGVNGDGVPLEGHFTDPDVWSVHPHTTASKEKKVFIFHVCDGYLIDRLKSDLLKKVFLKMFLISDNIPIVQHSSS